MFTTGIHVNTRGIVSFYLIAFALSWLVQIPLVLAARGVVQIELADSLGLLSSVAPLIAALIVTVQLNGRAGIRRLLSRLLQWRISVRWYTVALLGFPGLASAAITLGAFLTGEPPDIGKSYIDRVFPQFPHEISPLVLLLPFFLYSVVTTIPEEIGWRGVALPQLQRSYGPLWASLVVGLLWGLWHLPLFFLPTAAQSGLSFPLFLAGTVVSSFLFTWVFNGTRGSLLAVVLLHSSFNVSTVFLPLLPQVTGSDLQLLLFVGLIAVAAVVLAVVRLGKDQA